MDCEPPLVWGGSLSDIIADDDSCENPWNLALGKGSGEM